MGTTFVGERILVASSGNVTDKIIKEYIMNQDLQERSN